MVTMTYEKHGRTLNGTDPVPALVTLQSLGADAVGCNCSAGPEAMLGMIAAMKPHATVPLVAKPNAGLPKLVGDATVFDLDAAGLSPPSAGRLRPPARTSWAAAAGRRRPISGRSGIP